MKICSGVSGFRRFPQGRNPAAGKKAGERVFTGKKAMRMTEEEREKYLFEKMPVPKAVAVLAVPTIISQVVTMIYNLADTFFVGQIGDPLMVAAVSLVSPWFNLLTALGNLFGLGAGSLISRMMGAQNHEDIRYVAAFSIWGGAATTLFFSLITWLARVPLLNFLGASMDTYAYAEDYLLWVVAVGGVPTMVSLALGHLLRSEGHAKQAGAGMMFGGILNVILDPVFIFAFHLEVAGAAIATALSGSPLFPGVSPSFSGVFSDFTSFSGRAPHFLGVVPELLLLPVFTSFFGSSSPFSGVVKETPDFSLASPDFPEALHLFSVLLKSTSLFWCSPAFFKAFSFSWYFRKITRFFRCSPAFSRCFFWIPSDFSPSLPGSSENFLDSLCVFDAFMAASPSQWYD